MIFRKVLFNGRVRAMHLPYVLGLCVGKMCPVIPLAVYHRSLLNEMIGLPLEPNTKNV